MLLLEAVQLGILGWEVGQGDPGQLRQPIAELSRAIDRADEADIRQPLPKRLRAGCSGAKLKL